MKSTDSGYQLIDAQGMYMLNFVVHAYTLGNYQPYVHITGVAVDYTQSPPFLSSI